MSNGGGPSVSSTIQYRHIGNSANKHNGVITIITDKQPKSNQIGVAIALCSPKDTFSKAKGRMISKGRLESVSKYAFGFMLNDDKNERVALQVIKAIRAFIDEEHLPRWSQKLIVDYVKHYKEKLKQRNV